MTKYCSKCGKENDDNSRFCRSCGKRLSEIHAVNTNNNSFKIGNNKILIGVIVVLLIVIAIIGTYAIVALNNDNNSSDTTGGSVDNVSNKSVSDVSTENTKSWHKIDSFNGVGDNVLTLTIGKNPIKVVSSAMPLKNYADNYMDTTVTQNGYTVGSSQLSWGSNSAVATKSDTIEFTGSGTYYIYISTYELDYWNLEVYEYY